MTEKMYQAKRNGAQLLDGTVSGAKITDGTIMDVDVNTAASIALAKVAHVGSGNVLRSNGTSNVGGQIAGGDIAAQAVTGRGPTLLVAAAGASALVRKQADYLCDGTADQVEINAALAALPSGGGWVQLSEGAFSLTSGITTSVVGSTLAGQGRAATILTYAAGAATGPMVNLAHNTCCLRDLTLDGNKTQNSGTTTHRNWTVTGSDGLVENVWASQSAGNGCDIASGSARTRVLNCLVTSAAFVGLVAAGPNITVANCIIFANLTEGLYLTGTNVLAVGNQCVSNTNSGITLASPASNCCVVDNLSTGNGSYGINVSAGTNAYIGLNNLAGNTGGTVSDTATGTRRAVATADIQPNAVTQAAWQVLNATTNLTTYADINATGLPLTTVGGDILAWATYCGNMTANGNAAYLALNVDNGAEVAEVVTVPATGAAQFTQSTAHRFTGLAAGVHTVRARFRVSASQLNGFGGSLTVMELKR